MGREKLVARSVIRALTRESDRERPQSWPSRVLAALSAFFAVFQLCLYQVNPDVFAKLRQEDWKLKDDDYVSSFSGGAGAEAEDTLHSIGDMGFSGSTFYATDDQRFLVKSVPRPSEYTYFRDDLLQPYTAYMAAHPKSLLVRICDFLATTPSLAVGKVLGLAPSHHIIMDNVMYGAEAAKKEGKPNWQHWDLKPTSYFYPERDIAGGMLAGEETLDRLPDEFDGKILLTREHADDLFANLEEDTRLLAQHNATDYSLFLVRIAADKPAGHSEEDAQNPFADAVGAPDSMVPVEPPSVPPAPPSWRTGVPSADGRYVFRAAVLDFFWAKHKLQPMLMTLLISVWNLLTRQGPMSITTTPEEYRERFLKMCKDIVLVKGSQPPPDQTDGTRSEDAPQKGGGGSPVQGSAAAQS